MLRVRHQVGCSDELIRSCGNNGVTLILIIELLPLRIS